MWNEEILRMRSQWRSSWRSQLQQSNSFALLDRCPGFYQRVPSSWSSLRQSESSKQEQWWMSSLTKQYRQKHSKTSANLWNIVRHSKMLLPNLNIRKRATMKSWIQQDNSRYYFPNPLSSVEQLTRSQLGPTISNKPVTKIMRLTMRQKALLA